MHEILIISGKGGTGKTSITAAFAHIAGNHVICDLDVDAPDLHLLLKPEHSRIHEFISGNEAAINPDTCENCLDCVDRCRFDAIDENGRAPKVNPLKCEGCRVCVTFCPAGAIDYPEKNCGQWYLSESRFGPMVHAQLRPGEENSGKLVTLLRQKAKEKATELGLGLVLADGPPGIGCPVISALGGNDLAVIVTEPTPSGSHDLERVIGLCRHFRTPAGVIINKFDLNLDQTRRIELWCSENGLPVFARLPHDEAFTRAMVIGQVITEYQSDGLTKTIQQAWKNIINHLE
ncbi:MAG: (4Fe-4S)-binding protein [Deltaproteobacteria bacterium]|nr:MAG: (4Fe-4S)-binding protein [Deltaproteobacteria bacterium]